MQRAKYPENIGINTSLTSEEVNVFYQKFLLASRVGCVRTNFLAMKILMAIFLLGTPNMWDVLLGWSSLPGLLSLVPLFLTLSKKGRNILSALWGRIFIALLHSAHGYLVYSLHGFNIIPFMPFYLMIHVFLLDNPGHRNLLLRYLGTLMSSLAVIFLLVHQGAELWASEPEITRSRLISWLFLISTMCYLLHNIDYIHRQIFEYLDGNRVSLKPLLVCKVFLEKTHALFWIQCILVLYFAYFVIGFANQIASVYPNYSFQQVLFPFINFLCSVLGLGVLVTTRKVPKWLQLVFFIDWVLITYFSLYPLNGIPLFDNVLGTNLLVVFLLKPRWIKPSIGILLGLVLLLPWLTHISMNQWHSIAVGYAMVSFYAWYLFDIRLKLLKEINSLIERHNDEFCSVSASANREFNRSRGLRYYLVLAGYSCLVLCYVAFLNTFNNHRFLMEVQSNELANDIQRELMYSEQELVAYTLLQENRDSVVSFQLRSAWCKIRIHQLDNVSKVDDDHCGNVDEASSVMSDAEGMHTLVIDGEIFLQMQLSVLPNTSTIGLLNVSKWIQSVIQSHHQLHNYAVAISLNENVEHLVPILVSGSPSDQYAFTPIKNTEGEILFYLCLSLYESMFWWFWFIALQMIVVVFVVILLIHLSLQKNKQLSQVSHLLDETSGQLDAIEKLSGELSNALQDAQVANDAKERFLNVIGHEIRTPLNAMIGMIQAQNYYQMSPKVKGLSQNAQVSGLVLLNLVNDILDFSKLRSNQLSVFSRPFSLRHFCEQIDVQYRDVIELKGINFNFIKQIPDELILLGDELRLRQVLTNLLSNALKFTHKGVITFKTVAQVKDQQCDLSFVVSDTGIGIKQKDLGLILEPFTQVDMDKSRQFTGTGLGLSIVKEILGKMSSELEVSSKFGAGSTFSFLLSLPVSDLQQELVSVDGVEEVLPTEEIYKGAKIMVVDDDFINAEVIQELLTPLGVKVLEATDYSSALEALKSSPVLPNFILMDQQMPELSGDEMTILLRKIYPIDVLPIIGFTADLPDNVKKQMLGAGVNECISKPITMAKLKELLDIHFLKKSLN